MSLRIRRLGLAAGVLVLGALAWFLFAFGRIAAGYAALIGALLVYGGGQPLEAVRVERLGLPLGLGAALELELVEGEREARATFLGLIERRARHRTGLGATRIGPNGELAPMALPDLVAPLAADVPWPSGDSEVLAPLPDAKRRALEAAVGHAFGRGSGAHAVVVVQEGRLLLERYAPGCSRSTPLLGWSMTKSVTATLLARLVVLGRLASLAAQPPVPEWSAEGDERQAITLEQLLRMTSGLGFFANYELPWSDSLQMLFASSDVAAFAAEKPLVQAPGSVWSYSDGTSNLLARCVRLLASDEPEEQQLFPQRALFGPLGMASAELSVDAVGNWVGSSLMLASARDWARFGWLYVEDAQQLLPPGWAEFVARATPESPNHCYGAHFWRYDAASGRLEDGSRFPASLGGIFYAAGHDGQYVWIDRARRAVVVRLGVRGEVRFEAEDWLAEVLAALDEG